MDINQDNITLTLWESQEDETMFLDKDNKNIVEILSNEDDGIFPKTTNWEDFKLDLELYGLDEDLSNYIHVGTLAKTLYEECKWCVQVGQNKFIQIDPKELEFSFSYEMYFSKDSKKEHVEVIVEAKWVSHE